MKRYIFTLLISLMAFSGFSQETPPPMDANFKQLSTSTFFLQLPDSAIWQYKGITYGWAKIARYKDVKSVIDGLALKVDKTTTVNGHPLSSNVTVTKGDVGLGNVDNTSDVNKPISTATQAALDLKAEGFYQIPNGKNVVDFLIDGKNARVTTSNNYSTTGTPQKLAIFFHFYGGNYTTGPSSKLRDSLFNNGYSIASISAGESWGNEKAQQLYFQLYNHVIKKFNVEKQPIAVSASMGTLTAFNIINRNTIPFRAFVSTIGVVNLGEYYGRAVGFSAGNDIQTAYQFSTPADSTKAFFGFNPYSRLKTEFGDTTYKVSCPVYFINGAIDTSTPIRYTSRVYTGLNRTYSNSVLEIVPGIGHDTAIVTSAIAGKVMLWLKSNPLTTRALPDTAIVLKTNNGIRMRDKIQGTAQTNFIDFQKNDGTRRGLFGFLNSSVIGDNGMGWTNIQGNSGIFSETDSEISMGTVSPVGVITKNFILNKTYTWLNGSLGIGIIPTEKFHVKGKFRIDRLVGSNYTLIDSESGAAAFLGKNTGSATFSQMIFNQGNNTTDREMARFDVNGNFLIGVTSGSERLVVNGKATVSSAPTNATDVVRKTELDLKASLASPALTGIPTAPTAATGTNTTQIATMAAIQAAVSSGSGTPTSTAITNVTTTTANPQYWIKVGNVITVSGTVSITPTATGPCSVSVTLPIASNFTSVYDLAGVAKGDSIAGHCYGDVTNDKMIISLETTAFGGSTPVRYSFSYNVL